MGERRERLVLLATEMIRQAATGRRPWDDRSRWRPTRVSAFRAAAARVPRLQPHPRSRRRRLWPGYGKGHGRFGKLRHVLRNGPRGAGKVIDAIGRVLRKGKGADDIREDSACFRSNRRR